jgi:hypothetical protein
LADVPDHLRDVLLEAPYRAADRVFDAAVKEKVGFLVLAGDILDVDAAGMRGPLYLIEQFERLAEHGVAVYWAGGIVDSPHRWPAHVRLPDNVYVLPPHGAGHYTVNWHGSPLVRLVGMSRDGTHEVRGSEIRGDAAGLFSVAVVHGLPQRDSLAGRRIHYWALGGAHQEETILADGSVAHFPGSPQGRHSGEPGPHGCSLVAVDQHQQIRTSRILTDVVRWHHERITVNESADWRQLEEMLHRRIATLIQSSPGQNLLIHWSVAGDVRLTHKLRDGGLAARLLQSLQADYGHGLPSAWSVGLDIVADGSYPHHWYEQDGHLGELLRVVRRSEDGAAVLDLPAGGGSGSTAAWGELVRSAGPQARHGIVRQAARWGVEWLVNEEMNS